MTTTLRDSGLPSLGEVAWGAHVCQFFDTAADLLRLVTPYIRAGLGNNEMCVWVTGGLVGRHDAIAALERQMVDVEAFQASGQLQICDYRDVYGPGGGRVDQEHVIARWVNKLDLALSAGYDGLRITGNPFWLSNREEWQAFGTYEAAVHRAMQGKPIIALCTYSLHTASARDVLDVLDKHHTALVHRHDAWDLLECARDTRTRAELAEAHEQLRLHGQILDHLSEGVALVRASDGVFVYANPKFERMFGYQAGELVGLPVHVVNAPNDRRPEETAEMIIESLRQHATWRGELENLKKDGSRFWCSVSVSTFHHAEHGTVWVAVHTDMTEQKTMEAKRLAAEMALKSAHDELERRVEDRTAKLGIVNAQLSEKIADLEAFHDVVVGRELRMIELEKEIAKLRERLTACGDGS